MDAGLGLPQSQPFPHALSGKGRQRRQEQPRLLAAIGRPLADVVPEFAPLLRAAEEAPEKARTAEIQIGPTNRRRTVVGLEGYGLNILEQRPIPNIVNEKSKA